MKIITKSQAVSELSILALKSRYTFFSEGKFWTVNTIPLTKKINLIKAGLDNFIPRNFCLSQPTGAMIEPTDLCNLHCTGCWTNDESHKGRSRYLSVEGFKKVMDDLGQNLFIIWLWGWGEPFLNKNIYEMIRLARDKDIIVISSTNGNLKYDKHEIEELIKSGLSMLIVAIDGVDQETYGTYRIGGKLDLVLENIKKIIEYKKILGLKTPLINMRMVVMRHNQDQVGELRALGEYLGVDIVSLKTMCDYRKNEANPLFPTIKKYQRYRMDEMADKVLDINQRFYCNRPWRRLHIFADGSATPCEFDFEREFLLGNINNNRNLKSIWNNLTARDFRHKFLANINSISFCRNCPYKNQIVWDPTVEWHQLAHTTKM